MRIRHLVIPAIAVLALALSACAGGAGTGTQSASGAASGGSDSSASANSATSGAEGAGAGQSADAGVDSAVSADSAASSAGVADAPASAPSAAGASQSGQAAFEPVDASTVLEFTHIPEGYEEAPGVRGELGYKKGLESGFVAMVGKVESLPPGLTAVDAFKYAQAGAFDLSSVKEGEKVSGDGVEFQTAHAVMEGDGQKFGTITAVAERDGKLVVVAFLSPAQGEEVPEVDPALVKSVLEGIKWKK